jgi:hypothetical protein
MASPGSSGADAQALGMQRNGAAPAPARNVDSGASGGGGDAVGPRQDADDGASASDAGTGSSTTPVSSSARQPNSGNHSSVGWQSLLPGSIQ